MSQETLNIVITAIIVPIVAALVPLFITFLNAKTEQLKKRTNNEELNVYIDIAEDAIETSVVSTYETFVKVLKEHGTFDEEAQQEAFTEAKNKAIAIMGASAREALAEVYGDLDSWINNKIEIYVKKNKIE